MTESQSGAKSVLPSDGNFDFAAWKAVFQLQLRRSRRAQASWDELVLGGCKPDVLLRNAAYACDFEGAPGKGHVFGDFKDECEREVKRAEKAARQLQSICDDVGNLLSEDNRSALARASSNAILELKDDIASIENFLSAGDMTPNQFLVELVEEVRKHTGSPHYRKIYEVLDVAYSAHRKTEIAAPGEEALRKAVNRFKLRHPEGVTSSENGFSAALLAVVLWIVLHFSNLFKKHPDGSDSPDTERPKSSREPVLPNLKQ